ncbi:hypothetical protein EU527_03225 [Candidatus Thorarchaeota archaeon]|nr:MAG: hypothetical protein EU527_03225 [Candidatus Thorarchaeota archaeon]
MWLEVMLIPFVANLVLFFIFWIVHEGSRWQKHPYLGGFARIIQKSPRTGFLVFFILTVLFFPTAILVMLGLWWDTLLASRIPSKTDVVNVMLIMFLIMAFVIPVMWSSLRTWRHAARAEAEEKVKMTGV